MEFTDDDDDDHQDEHLDDDEDEDDDGDEGITIPTPIPTPATGIRNGAGVGSHTPASTTRYRECQKNHAVGIGGHAVDGCGEFMPAGEDGSLEALKCAACGCHRNFHRNESDAPDPGAASSSAAAAAALHHHHPHHQQPFQAPPYYHRTPVPPPPPPQPYLHHHLHHPHPLRPLALPSSSGGGRVAEEMEELSNPSSSGGGSGSRKKRFRTKFTAEQKERMAEFAERIGWRIQKQDEAAVEQFCREVNVTRQVLKVWLHNNKHSLAPKP